MPYFRSCWPAAFTSRSGVSVCADVPARPPALASALVLVPMPSPVPSLAFLRPASCLPMYALQVRPPRLDGIKTGLYSTRTPHRPNAIGLSLAQLHS
eukprot:5112539-Pleurochrysis_carterae.AAC.1